MSKKDNCDMLITLGFILAGLTSVIAYLKTVEGCNC
jgi:hypothetical protein